MKQHITKEQYHELSDNAKIKLVEWISKRTKVTDPITFVYQDITIGRMIEFLIEKTDNFELRSGRMKKSYLNNVPDGSVIWHGWANHTEIEDEYNLCDALWEAVKQELES